jgi:hypothetical protein
MQDLIYPQPQISPPLCWYFHQRRRGTNTRCCLLLDTGRDSLPAGEKRQRTYDIWYQQGLLNLTEGMWFIMALLKSSSKGWGEI